MKLCYARAQAQYASFLTQQQERLAHAQEEEKEGREEGKEGGVPTAGAAERKRRGTEEAVASLTESWSFAAGWAMMELLRIKSSPVRPSLPPSFPPSFLYFDVFNIHIPSLPPFLLRMLR